MPRQRFHHHASTATDIASVWAALDDPSTWEAIPGVDRVIDPEIDDAGRLSGFSFETLIGGKAYRGEATPAGREERHLMAWDIDSSEIEGAITVRLSPEGAGTRVEVALAAEGVGMIGSLFFPVIAAAIGNGFTTTVEEFVAGL